MKKLLMLLVVVLVVAGSLRAFRVGSGFDVANVVDPLVDDITSKACGDKFVYTNTVWALGSELIFKDIPVNKFADRGCASGTNKEMFARCYQWAWAKDIKSIGSQSDYRTNRLFQRPVKDVDLHSFTCVDTKKWPYQDKDWEKHPIGVIYEVK
jgi:hypothetical protein